MEPGGYWARAERVTVQGQAFDEAWQVRTARRPSNPWGVMLKGTFDRDVPAGHTVWITFAARSLVGGETPEIARGQLKAHGDMQRGFKVGADWHRFGYAFLVNDAIEAGTSKIEFFLGYQAQTIQLADVRVLDLGADADGVRELPAWSEAVATRKDRSRDSAPIVVGQGAEEPLQLPPTPEVSGTVVATADDLSPRGHWAQGERLTLAGAVDAGWRVTTRRKPGQPWGVLLKGVFADSVPAGHRVWITFAARSAVEAGSTAVARATLKAQGGQLNQAFRVGPAWHRFGFSFRAAEPIAAGQTELEFLLGYNAQTLDIVDFRAIDLGPNGRAPATATWTEAPVAQPPPDAAAGGPLRDALLADELAAFPPPTYVIHANETSAQAAFKHTAGNTRRTLVSAEGRAFDEATRLDVFVKPDRDFRAQFTARNGTPIRAGDALLIAFDARAISSDHASGHGAITLAWSQASAPYRKCFIHRVDVGHGWQPHLLRGKADRDYAPGEGKLEMWLGDRRQVLEIGGVTVFNFGSGVDVADLPTQDLGLDYPGREADAPWRSEALARIDDIRKAPLRVCVVDATGAPVPGASVEVEQQEHAFVFGTTLDMRKLHPAHRQGVDSTAYERLLTSGMFNLLVPGNEFKWPAWTGAFGGFYRPERATEALDWAEQRGVAMKGHVLVWNLPGKVRRETEMDPAKVTSAIRERITDAAGQYRGRLVYWDVINENYKHNTLTNLLGDDVVVDWFKLARQAAGPNARLLWNEIHVLPDTQRGREVRAHTLARVQNLIDKDAPVDMIGIQGHLSVGPASPSPEFVLEKLDEIATLGLPIQITEFDVNVRDREDPDQLAFQADYTRDFLIATFSHPAVEGVIYWTPVAFKWLPDAALAEKDLTLRPHGEVWRELVTQTWWTRTQGTTDVHGVYATDAFRGKHLVRVTQGDRLYEVEITLGADADNETIIIDLKP